MIIINPIQNQNQIIILIQNQNIFLKKHISKIQYQFLNSDFASNFTDSDEEFDSFILESIPYRQMTYFDFKNGYFNANNNLKIFFMLPITWMQRKRKFEYSHRNIENCQISEQIKNKKVNFDNI